MKIFPGFGSAFLLGTLGGLTAGLSAEVKVEELDLAPAGRWMACSTSPHGIHAAAVAMKGSRYVVYVDGVEGPRIEMMLTLNGAPCSFGNNMVVGTNIMPVAFSDDGAHCAYFAKAGDEYVLYLDQKEFARGKQGLLNQAALPPTFSAGAKHLFYMEADTSAGYRLMVDGKPEPWLQNPPQLVLSMDGTRYAYVATMRGAQKPTFILDGKDVGPIGDDPHFTADGKHLFTTIHQGQVTGLVVDGKPKLKTDGVVQLYFPTVGDGFAAVLQRLSPPGQFLFVNGHKVAGSDCQYITNVYFSPDGKRYAALCRTAGNNQYMIVDGKKGEEYASIDLPSPGPGGLWNSAGLAWADGRTQDEETASWTVATPAFTPDSARFLYSAAVQPQHFLVIDGEESDGYMQAVDPVYGTQGKHIGYIGYLKNSTTAVVVDGKTTAVPGAHCLGFSPDGAHYAYLAGHDGQLVLDGVAQPVVNSNAVPGYLFSPDSKHWVMTGYSEAKGGRRGLFVDGKLVLNDEHGGTAASRPIFTPDSQHLLWISPRRTETTDDRDSSELFVDGQDTHIRFVGFYASVRGDWEMSADGTLSFIVRTGDAVKRYRVTPPADTSVATMLAHAS